MPDYGSGGGITVIMEGPFSVGGAAATNMTSISAPVANWKGATSPYSQVVDMGKVSINSKVDIQMSTDQLEQFKSQIIAFTTENAGGVVTLYAIGDKPAGDCVFQATLTDVVNVGGDGGVIRGNTICTIFTPEECLPTKGGTMNGNIDMNNNEINNVRTPYTDKGAANKKYVDDKADNAEKNAKEYADTKTTEVTLTAAGWSAEAPYTQTVTVVGLTDQKRAMTYPKVPDDATAAAAQAEETIKISSCKRTGDQMTFRCLEDKPGLDITVIVEVRV